MDPQRLERLRRWVVDLFGKCPDKDLEYHNAEHTLDVTEAAGRNAEREGIGEDERELLLAAALFHDTGFTQAYEDNEPLAVGICRATLPELGFSEPQIARIGELILATRMPQRPATRLEAIICDADLDYLGRQDFFTQADRLRREWATRRRAMTDREWLERQIDFVGGHRYFLESVRALRDGGKAENLMELRRRLARQE